MSNNHNNGDQNRLRIGDDIRIADEELRALGGRVPTALDDFHDVQERFATRLGAYEAQDQRVQQSALIRKAHRAVLVEQKQKAWELVPSVGVTAEPKSKPQVEQERALLFPFGRPQATAPGDHALLLGTEALLSALTADTALARAWSEESLAAISKARDAFAPAYEEWRKAWIERKALLTELELLRAEWFESLGELRDAVKRSLRRQKLPNRYAALLRYRRPSKPKPEEVEEPPSP